MQLNSEIKPAKTFNVFIESEFFNCDINTKNSKNITKLLLLAKRRQKEEIKRYIDKNLKHFSYKLSSKTREILKNECKEIFKIVVKIKQIDNINTGECFYDIYKKGKQTKNSNCVGFANICLSCKYLSKNNQLTLPL